MRPYLINEVSLASVNWKYDLLKRWEKLENTDKLLRQVLLKNMKGRAEHIINDYNRNGSTQNEDTCPSEIVKYFFENEDDGDDDILVTI